MAFGMLVTAKVVEVAAAKVSAPVQMLLEPKRDAGVVRQVPFTLKQPVAMLRP